MQLHAWGACNWSGKQDNCNNHEEQHIYHFICDDQ